MKEIQISNQRKQEMLAFLNRYKFPFLPLPREMEDKLKERQRCCEAPMTATWGISGLINRIINIDQKRENDGYYYTLFYFDEDKSLKVITVPGTSSCWYNPGWLSYDLSPEAPENKNKSENQLKDRLSIQDEYEDIVVDSQRLLRMIQEYSKTAYEENQNLSLDDIRAIYSLQMLGQFVDLAKNKNRTISELYRDMTKLPAISPTVYDMITRLSKPQYLKLIPQQQEIDFIDIALKVESAENDEGPLNIVKNHMEEFQAISLLSIQSDPVFQKQGIPIENLHLSSMRMTETNAVEFSFEVL